MQYSTFPSDAVLAFTTARARLNVSDKYGSTFIMGMDEYLSLSWDEFQRRGLILISITITEAMSQTSSETVMLTYKVAQRGKNAHAIVNTGFQYQLLPMHSAEDRVPFCLRALVVVGGVSKKTFIAKKASDVLSNAPLNAMSLKSAMIALQEDLIAVGFSDDNLHSKPFRVSVMQSYLYRSFLSCYRPDQLTPNLLSAVLPWVQPVSRLTEVFMPPTSSTSDNLPVGKPIRKLEAPIQATGEAVYPSDEVTPHNGLHAAIVYSTKCAVKLVSLDASAALACDGVVSFCSAVDVPGANMLGTGNALFVSIGDVVKCIGAPLGVICATSEALANKAASKVVAKYEDIGLKPVTNLQQALSSKSFFTDVPRSYGHIRAGNPEQAMRAAQCKVKGRVEAGGQYHFYMETQNAMATLVDGKNLHVICSTQDPSNYQTQIANVLSLTQNQVR